VRRGDRVPSDPSAPPQPSPPPTTTTAAAKTTTTTPLPVPVPPTQQGRVSADSAAPPSSPSTPQVVVLVVLFGDGRRQRRRRWWCRHPAHRRRHHSHAGARVRRRGGRRAGAHTVGRPTGNRARLGPVTDVRRGSVWRHSLGARRLRATAAGQARAAWHGHQFWTATAPAATVHRPPA